MSRVNTHTMLTGTGIKLTPTEAQAPRQRGLRFSSSSSCAESKLQPIDEISELVLDSSREPDSACPDFADRTAAFMEDISELRKYMNVPKDIEFDRSIRIGAQDEAPAFSFPIGIPWKALNRGYYKTLEGPVCELLARHFPNQPVKVLFMRGRIQSGSDSNPNPKDTQLVPREQIGAVRGVREESPKQQPAMVSLREASPRDARKATRPSEPRYASQTQASRARQRDKVQLKPRLQPVGTRRKWA